MLVELVHHPHQFAAVWGFILQEMPLQLGQGVDVTQNNSRFFVLLLRLKHPLAHHGCPSIDFNVVVHWKWHRHCHAGHVLRKLLIESIGLQEHLQHRRMTAQPSELGTRRRNKVGQGIMGH